MTGRLRNSCVPLSLLSDHVHRKIVGSIVCNAIRKLPDDFDRGDNVLMVDVAMALATDFERCAMNLNEFRLAFPAEWMIAGSKFNSETQTPHLSMLAFLGHVLFLFPPKTAMRDALSSREASYRRVRGLDNDGEENADNDDRTTQHLLEFGKLLREDPLFEGLGSALAKKFPRFVKEQHQERPASSPSPSPSAPEISPDLPRPKERAGFAEPSIIDVAGDDGNAGNRRAGLEVAPNAAEETIETDHREAIQTLKQRVSELEKSASALRNELRRLEARRSDYPTDPLASSREEKPRQRRDATQPGEDKSRKKTTAGRVSGALSRADGNRNGSDDDDDDDTASAVSAIVSEQSLADAPHPSIRDFYNAGSERDRVRDIDWEDVSGTRDEDSFVYIP